MPNQVQKKKRISREFQLENLKRSIENSAQEARFFKDKIFKVVEEISIYVLENIKDLDSVDRKLMRTLILNKLDETYSEVSNVWRKYDQKVKGIKY